MAEAQVVIKSFVQMLSLTTTTRGSLETDISSGIKGKMAHFMADTGAPTLYLDKRIGTTNATV